jgi:3-dehydroquinate dehydratase/shikimate dehydrogenase
VNNGKICVSVCAETPDEMIANIKRAEEFADVIEVRFDCLAEDDLKSVVAALPEIEKTYLFTFRPVEQGGRRELTIGERLKFWEFLFHERTSGFMIDLEFDPKMLLAVQPTSIERIVSLHEFEPTHDLESIWEAISAVSDSTVKVAVSAGDITDSIPVWQLLRQAKTAGKEIIPVAMGEAGKWTRILGLAHGACLTYGSLERGKETAHGQITATDLIETYRVKELDQETIVFGIVGDPVSSSLSPYMQNPAFVAGGVNAVFIPLLVKDLDEFIRRMVRPETREVELNFGGFSVTMPHKQAIMKHLDEIDPTAKKIGAVNTVKIEGGKLIGYNTDAHGFITPIKQKFGDLKGERVAVGGAGGGARACVYALKEEGADVTVYARDQKKAESFAEEFGVAAGIPEGSFPPGSIDILVNATPLGMKGGETEATIATAAQLDGIKLVYDLVYNPTETRLLREAKKAGVLTLGGIEMLVTQGAKQFEIWTGREAPIELMRECILNRINNGR